MTTASSTRGTALQSTPISSGMIRAKNRPNFGFLYEVSTVQHPDYFPGDVIDLGKRKFTYSLSDAACTTHRGVEIRALHVQTMDNVVTAAAKGAISLTIDGGTHAALTKDELRNGYLCLFNADASIVYSIGLLGNDAAESNADFTIYLDSGLPEAVDTTWNAEVVRSPWRAVRLGTSSGYTKGGVPMAPVSAASMFFWTQTDGPTFVDPAALVGDTDNRTAQWRHDGSLNPVATGDGNISDQVAGLCVTGSAAGNGPLFALRGSF